MLSSIVTRSLRDVSVSLMRMTVKPKIEGCRRTAQRNGGSNGNRRLALFSAVPVVSDHREYWKCSTSVVKVDTVAESASHVGRNIYWAK